MQEEAGSKDAGDGVVSPGQIARAFVTARAKAQPMAAYPGPHPATLDAAYAIQAEAIALWGAPILGWKVGRIPRDLIGQLGTDRLAGPIFKVSSPWSTALPELPVFEGGFAAVEPEFMLRVGRLPTDSAITNAEAQACIDEIRVGLEVASSPFTEINDHGPMVTISDFGANHGIYLGPIVPMDSDFQDWAVSTAIDGLIVGKARARDMLDGPFGAARFLFEIAATGASGLKAGDWISSGAVSGVHRVTPGAKVEIRFGDRCRLALTIGAQTPTE